MHELDERSRGLLKSLIELHIETGEPVGSESLARSLGRILSSATLRNIMSDLERAGYLEQPHTSAGRLPTDEGYRFFVDILLSQPPLPPTNAVAIDSELRLRDGTPTEVFEAASHLLSRLSGSVGFVLAPDIGRESFRHIGLMRLPHPRVLVVTVSRAGLVTHRVIELDDPLSQADLQTCANYLNEHFADVPLSTVRAQLLDLMHQEKAQYDSLLQRVISIGRHAFARERDESEVYIDGTANILEHRGLDDIERMRAIFKTFEEKSRLVTILNACLADVGVRVVIGKENPDPGLQDMSLVTAIYPVAGQPGGGLGVIGSMRMEYRHTIALVDHVARSLSRALTEMQA